MGKEKADSDKRGRFARWRERRRQREKVRGSDIERRAFAARAAARRADREVGWGSWGWMSANPPGAQRVALGVSSPRSKPDWPHLRLADRLLRSPG